MGANKTGSNLARQGVSLSEAAAVFGDALCLTIPDPAHPQALAPGEGKIILVISRKRA